MLLLRLSKWSLLGLTKLDRIIFEPENSTQLETEMKKFTKLFKLNKKKKISKTNI